MCFTQIQLSLAAQQTKVLLQQYSERSITIANQAWHNPKMEKIQELVKDFVKWMLEAAEKSKLAVLDIADPSKFVDEILRLLRNEGNMLYYSPVRINSSFNINFWCIHLICSKSSFVAFRMFGFFNRKFCWVFSGAYDPKTAFFFLAHDCRCLLELRWNRCKFWWILIDQILIGFLASAPV